MNVLHGGEIVVCPFEPRGMNLRSFQLWGKPDVAHRRVFPKMALFNGLSG
jgi:hypothetical protein